MSHVSCWRCRTSFRAITVEEQAALDGHLDQVKRYRALHGATLREALAALPVEDQVRALTGVPDDVPVSSDTRLRTETRRGPMYRCPCCKARNWVADPVREWVADRVAAKSPVHLPASTIASRCGVASEVAEATLSALAAEGVLTRRLWVLCGSCASPVAVAEPPSPDDPNYEQRVKDDPLGVRVASLSSSCRVCDERSSPRDPATLVCWALPGTAIPKNLGDVLPGPELDRLVADALGVVPCDAWEPTNLGSVGGPAVMARGCYHAQGACYPTVTNGRAGGLPPFSRPEGRRHHAGITLDDLPPYTSLHKDEFGRFVVRFDRYVAVAATEPHALALAVLDAKKRGTLAPRHTAATRWHPRWVKVAADKGIAPEGPPLPPPWTPRLVLALDDLLSDVEREARHETAVALEATRPRRDRMLFSEFRPLGGDRDAIRADLFKAGLDLFVAALEAEAKERGASKARQEFNLRTVRLMLRE
jgi:hypothetical protein